jgi:periplasmic copper chaperone A
MMRLVAVVLVLIGFATSAWAGDIVVSRAIVVAPPNINAPTIAAYFTIENHGAKVDQLIGISTASAASAMLHETTNNDGVMKMNMLGTLDIAAGATVEMKPAQLHVMLVGPKAPYKVGDDVAFELRFATSGKMQVVAKVVPLSQALGP